MKLIRIAAAQMKFRATVAGNVALIGRMIREAAERKCDAVLFPECALTGYNVDFGRMPRNDIETGLAAVAESAREHSINVLLGAPTFAGRRRYNSLIVLDRKGRETFRYHKIHLTPRDTEFFRPGNAVALFHIDRIPATAIICHERRYPELVRLGVMMGARILFHANAGLDTLAVSKLKRNGRDGIPARAFENQIHYVFANSAGPQGNGLWSAGDSKIIGPDSAILALANHRDETLIDAEINPARSGRKYALEALRQPVFLREHWRAMIQACRRAVRVHTKP